MVLFKSTHRSGLRRAFAVLSSFSLMGLVLFLSYSADDLPWASNHSFLLDTQGCRIPDWDPYDPSVRGFVHQVSGLFRCSGLPSPLLVVPGGAVRLDHAILTFYYGREDLTCTYRPIMRDPGPPLKPTDSRFAFGTPLPLPFDTPLGEDFILAECPMADFPNFTQFLPLVPLKPAVEGRKAPLQQEGRRPLNIIMVGIDSVSKLNFLRHFRKTRKFLKDNLSYFELKGYTKVADNTFPNLVPLLTGHFIEHYWNESVPDMFFDDLDFIWKKFSERGYRTLLAEDAPRMATFNYLKKGFRDPPTDYYYRPFALAIEKSLTRHHFDYCLQSKFETEILFDYLKSFVQTMQQRLLFAFAFAARLTHNSLNAAGYADEPTFSLLRELHDKGDLNRSLLILYSDHGIRFGPIRLTYIGKFEERMPFAYLSFPPWFLKQRPDLARNLRDNQNRLTTPFDIHATLAHLLNLHAGPPSTPHGLSLLGKVPAERTCEQAAVLPHWCPCHTHWSVSVSEPVVQNCGLALIDTINALLLPHKTQCAALRLEKVLDAIRLGKIDDAKQKVDRHVVLGKRVNAPVDYLVVISTQPSGGIFEGTVRYDAEGGTYNVLDDIGRLNVYGNQSTCIRNARMRKFCYCKSSTLSRKP